MAIDIVSVLTDSKDPAGYLKDMRRRDEGFNEGWGQIATLLKIITPGGKQSINCVSTKGAFIGSPGYRLMETETIAEDREKFG